MYGMKVLTATTPAATKQRPAEFLYLTLGDLLEIGDFASVTETLVPQLAQNEAPPLNFSPQLEQNRFSPTPTVLLAIRFKKEIVQVE